VSPRPSACLLPLPLCKPLALAVVLKTALSCTSAALCDRDFTERRKRVYNTENREPARVDCYWLATTAL
jgi:hypothetical protein